ncbi:MAG: hypothetical protein AAFP19_02140 [Bacteroidota bacterium]
MKKLVLLALIGTTLFACSDDDQDQPMVSSNCDFELVFSIDQFNNGPADPLIFKNVEIVDNCMQITFSAGGCDGESWEMELIDSTLVLDSDPAQRTLRLSLRDMEDCEALITKEVSFDLSALKENDSGQVWLNIIDYDIPVLYEY